MEATSEPGLRSWVPVPAGSDFPLQNLPYGVVSRTGGPPAVGVAIGDHVLDLSAVARAGLFDGHVDGARALFSAATLNPFLARGRATWTAARRRIAALLTGGNHELRRSLLAGAGLLARADLTLHLPVDAGDYVDFSSSLEHATNVGRIFRPDDEPLLPNWRHLPVGYHGRTAGLVVSGTPVRRPLGQWLPAGSAQPTFGPTRELDFELEVGFVTGPGNDPGARIPAAAAREHIFGLVLVNDWSARDIQAWESRPLGPFLGKSFATSVSPWVVPLDALWPYRVPGPIQDPPVLEYLRLDEDWGLDVELSVAVQSQRMAAAGTPPAALCRTSLATLYWRMPQQLAHVTSNGARVRPGDLFASGTVSGPGPVERGSLLELTWRGERRLRLPDGTSRGFLDDGDTVVMAGRAGAGGRPRLGFGELRGTVLPAGV